MTGDWGLGLNALNAPESLIPNPKSLIPGAKKYMSRIGKKPITLPKGVSVKVNPDGLDIQGPKGKLTQRIPPGIAFEVVDGQLKAALTRP